MTRLGELDFPDRMIGFLPVWASQVVFALFCLTAAGVMRLLVELLWPGAGPFALTFPAVLVATLFARWQSGLMALSILALGAWYFVLPEQMSFHLANPGDAPRIAVNVASGSCIIAVAEVFRRAARRLVRERDMRIAERDLLLSEIDHRMRNNFASVIGIIDMQRRRAENPATRSALDETLARVSGIARAHNALYRENGFFGTVDLAPYLEDLCGALASALFLHGAVRLECEVESIRVSRDRALSIGLLTNELVTNAAKHAFVGRDHGTIRVLLGRIAEGVWLIVTDNGIGMPETPRAGSLGMRLVQAFASDAGGTFTAESGAGGSTFTVNMPD